MRKEDDLPMMRLDDDLALLDRLYARLTDALHQRPDPYGMPVTVAEIYQELVPYRTVRSDVGFAMNADYEHALLRLLSGESELARLEPESARAAIVRELQSPNPNVSIYREYAACDVWITPRTQSSAPENARDPWGDVELPGLPDGDGAAGLGVLELTEDEIELPQGAPATGSSPAPAAQADRDSASPAGSEPVAPPEAAEEAPSAPPVAPEPGRPLESARAAADRYAEARQSALDTLASSGNCVFCDSQLPAGRKARYCPFCGGDQTMRPCPECGEALEPAWVFCIACGAAAEKG